MMLTILLMLVFQWISITTLLKHSNVYMMLLLTDTWSFNDNEIIYATDTNSLENAPERKYDYLFLESNYDVEKLELARGKRSKYGYDPYISGLRHLSTKDCKTFYYLNRRDKSSELIELHMSERFTKNSR